MVEICKMVVLSTAHLTERTAYQLDHAGLENWPCSGGIYGPYGFFVYAHDENDGTIPEELYKVMVWARETHGAEYVLFDRDADTVVDLPVFDW